MGEFGEDIPPPSGREAYWIKRAQIWRDRAVRLGWGAPETPGKEVIAGTLRDDAQAMRELGLDPSIAANMEVAADILDRA